MGTLISLDNIHSVWPCGEASGQSRLDVFGLNDMADVNSVQQVDGNVGLTKASQSTIANQRWLRLNDTANILSGDLDFALFGWSKVDARLTQNQYIIGKSLLPSALEWYIWYRGATDKFLRVNLSPDGTGPSQVGVSSTAFGTITIDEWFWWYWHHDSVNNEVVIGVNDVYTAPLSHSGGVFNSGNATGGGAPFNIHAIENNPVALGSDSSSQHINYFRGRVLTPAERTLIFTSKAIYPYLTADEPLIYGTYKMPGFMNLGRFR